MIVFQEGQKRRDGKGWCGTRSARALSLQLHQQDVSLVAEVVLK